MDRCRGERSAHRTLRSVPAGSFEGAGSRLFKDCPGEAALPECNMGLQRAPRGWRRWRVIRVAAVLLAAALAGLLVITPRTAEWFLFLPDRSDPGDPPAIAGIEGRNVGLEAEDGVPIHGWWWEVEPAGPAVLFFHGNAGNIAGRVSTAAGLVRRGVSVFLLEYRGYGASEGSPSEDGILRDGRAGLDWVVDRVRGPERVVLYGRSLGGVVAASLGSRERVAGVILESSFTTLEEMASAVYPWIPRFFFRRLRGHYDNLSAVGRMDRPLLVVHGTADDLAPVEMGRTLHQRAGVAARWFEVEGAGHNDMIQVGGDLYFDTVAEFVKDVTAVNPSGHPGGG